MDQIDQASLGLSREYLVKKMDEPFVVAYHNYQIKLAELFGATSERAASDMREVLNFEIELAEVSSRKSMQKTFVSINLFTDINGS